MAATTRLGFQHLLVTSVMRIIHLYTLLGLTTECIYDQVKAMEFDFATLTLNEVKVVLEKLVAEGRVWKSGDGIYSFVFTATRIHRPPVRYQPPALPVRKRTLRKSKAAAPTTNGGPIKTKPAAAAATTTSRRGLGHRR